MPGGDPAMAVRGARGAIVVPEDERISLLLATSRLLGAMIERNSVESGEIASVIFTATPDLRSAFPAEAARQMGLTGVPLLCSTEIDVKGAMPRVVRILLLFNTELGQDGVAHVYLDGAESLRDDL